MTAKLWFLIPEIVLFAAAVIVSVMGLSRVKSTRDLSPLITVLALIVAAALTPILYANEERVHAAGMLMPMLGQYVKVVVCIVGALLAMLPVGLIDRNLEGAFATGRASFDAIRVTRGEFYAFFLLSIIGVMLITSANDLIWLFLALELTSLPTYVMVAIARSRRLSLEAAVKYFFLGAMSAAIFLFGFALIYGATGSIVLTDIQQAFEMHAFRGDMTIIAMVGVILALLGVCYKIAAAPMHFYAADVYQGAASPVTAFLGFVPKAAGMLTFMMLLYCVGWLNHIEGLEALPRAISATIFMIAVLTMTLGNVLALMQRSAKRVLAYSSIAHSGYMLIGVLAGPGLGYNAVLFYLFAYGIMNTAAFAVLSALEKNGEEIDDLNDLSGLAKRHPGLSAVLAIAALSLLGFPPLLGFVGKLYLFAAGVEAGQIVLVVIAALNSAISAWYYLKLAGLPFLGKPGPQSERVDRGPSPWPRYSAVLGAVAILVLWLFAGPIDRATKEAVGVASTGDGRTHVADAE